MTTSSIPLARIIDSTVGRKAIVAVTGLMLVGFVVAHLTGNFLLFKGADAMNAYAYFLKDNAALLWVARIGLIAIFVVHIATTLSLNLRSQSARPTDYAFPDRVDVTLSSRTMVVTGLGILAYVLLHLSHLTFGWIYPEYYELESTFMYQGREVVAHDVYGMTVAGFQRTWLSLTYVIAMVALGLHLTHGIQSVAQTLGFNHERYTPIVKKISIVAGVGLALGFASIPISVMTGIVGKGQ